VLFSTVVLAVLAILAGTRGGAWIVAGLVWLPAAAWVPLFFRDPGRSGPRGADLVIAPADGKIVSIAEVDEPDYLGGRVRRISVFMNVFNVHVNRYPTDGILEYRRYRPGRFVNATLDKASVDNEQMSLGIRGPRGPLLVRQIAGLVARRIVTDDEPGTRVHQGDRLGLIRFGSRVDTFVSMDAAVRVTLGDRVRAGETVLAGWTE